MCYDWRTLDIHEECITLARLFSWTTILRKFNYKILTKVMSPFRNISLEFGFIAQGELYLEQNFGMIWGKFPVQLFYFTFFFLFF